MTFWHLFGTKPKVKRVLLLPEPRPGPSAEPKMICHPKAGNTPYIPLSARAQGGLPEDSEERHKIVAAELLGQLLLQAVECTADGVGLKDGVAKDRTLSVHDPEMRHGHKSSNRRFDGHMAAVAVDTGSQLMTAVDVLPGNAPDNLGALELVEQSEANSGVSMEEAMGDAAYGDGDTRQAFADAGRTLVAKVPGRPTGNTSPRRTSILTWRRAPHLSGGECDSGNSSLWDSDRAQR